jgi:hypothetical protein
MCGQNIHLLNILEYFVDYNFVNQNTHTADMGKKQLTHQNTQDLNIFCCCFVN